MDNNGFHFHRLINEDDRLSQKSGREYPPTVYPFGSATVELFAHQFGDFWHVTEKKTGLKVGIGLDMDEAIKDANRVVDEIGHDKFVEGIKETLNNLNAGLEYDYGLKIWLDPKKEIIAPEAPTGADE